MHKDGDIDLNASLEALNKLLGYVLAFKVKVQPKFRNVVVLKYSSDLSLINTVMDLLPDAEVIICKVYFRGYWDSHILYLCSFVFSGLRYCCCISHAGIFQDPYSNP